MRACTFRWPPRLLGTEDCACDRCRPDRPAWCDARQAARSGSSRSGSNRDSPKPELVRDLGATYHTSSVSELGLTPDVIMECSGVGSVIAESLHAIGASGVVCLTGVGHGGRIAQISTADIASAVVVKNNLVFGSVNVNKRHWYRAAEALARADRSWLNRLITSREHPANFAKALTRNHADIKVIIQFSSV